MNESGARALTVPPDRAAAALGCPAPGCGAGARFLQRGLLPAERALVTSDSWTMTGVANADNLARCGACGLVYERAIPARLLGLMKEGIDGKEWCPLPSRF